MFRVIFLFLVFSITLSYAQSLDGKTDIQQLLKSAEKEKYLQLYKTEEKKEVKVPQGILKGAKEGKKEEVKPPIKKEEKPIEEEASIIEKMYQDKVNFELKLKQFGYKFFKGEIKKAYLPVGENYTLGPGDTISIYLWGDPIDILNMNSFYSLEVDREGKIFVPNLGVFYVWGLTVKKVKKIIKDALLKKIKNFEIEISLGKLRQFPVYVTGFVKNPGVVMATGVNTVIDILSMAGGISKNGSLRNIVLIRDGEKGRERINIDLYDLLVYGKPVDIRIKEGDTVYVNSIGRTAAITGMVKRSAIYELKDEKSITDLLELAGGTLPSAYEYGVKVYRTESSELKIEDMRLSKEILDNFFLKDGDLVVVRKISNFIENKVTVEGHVKYPGIYDIKKYPTVRDIVKKVGFFPDTNLFYGEIVREKGDGTKEYITFSPKDIISNDSNIRLKSQDTIRFYKFGDITTVDLNKFKDSLIVAGKIKYPGVYAYKKGMKLSDILSYDQLLVDTNLYYGEILRRTFPELEYKIITFSPQDILSGKSDVELKPMDKLTFFPKWIYKPIEISGEVAEKKIIPYYDGMTLLDALRDIKFKTEIRKLKVIVYRKPSKEILEEEKLKKLIKEKELEETVKPFGEENKKEVSEEEKIRRVLEKEEKLRKVRAEEYVLGKRASTVYLYDLLIKAKKDVNIRLQPGDKLVVLRTEATEKDKVVKILGEVRKPGIYKYKAGMRLYDLIKLAGGYTEDAYPKALIFIRESAKKLQSEQLQASLLAMEESITQSKEGFAAAGATPEERAIIEVTLEKQKRLFEILKKKAELGLGRIALDIPSSLEELKKAEDNIELQDGDFIYIPSKPNYVLVLGGVYNQISLPYKKEWKVKDYLQEVGGLKEEAKEEDIYIIKANGRVVSRRSTGSLLSSIKWTNNKLIFGSDFYDMRLEEGDTIVVPTEIKVPILWRPLLRDVTQIIFQALSTAVLAKRL